MTKGYLTLYLLMSGISINIVLGVVLIMTLLGI